MVLEDHVKAEDAVDALESSGLSDRAFTWVPGAPTPTLRELIERKRNVLILAENYGGAVQPWYHRAYEGLLQDTEYTSNRSRLSATPSRAARYAARRTPRSC